MYRELVLNSASDRALYAWLRFIRDSRWSRRQKKHLLQLFENPENVYHQPDVALAAIFNENTRQVGRIQLSDTTAGVVNQGVIERDFHWVKKEKVTLVTLDSDNYPEQLIQIDDSPLALFLMGNADLLSEPQVAMVGSRRPSPVGAKIASDVSAGLAQLGLAVVSGMALGVDGLCHQGALDCGGATIAVLGCGLDIIYPARHRVMYQRVRENGLLVSEYPPGVKPAKYRFPERNRIVSGLALGVVIIEAAIRSGTLITARLALEQNKEVMVLPGSAVSKQYEGSHRLLREGAALVTCVDDVLHVLSRQLGDYVDIELAKLKVKEIERVENDDLGCNPLLSLIGAESVSVDEIILNSGLTPAQVSSMLLELELKGLIAPDGLGGYVNLV